MTRLFQRLASRWIAGQTIDEGIDRVRKANSRGILGLLNLLGEHFNDREQIEVTIQEYSRLLQQIEESKVNSQISIKPTQLGMTLDYDFCLQNYLTIAEECQSRSQNWLWVDMEDSRFTQKTVDLYGRLISKYPNSGIAIQANLKRSEGDLKILLELGGNVRLVKGAYNEPREIAFKSKSQISENYSNLMKMLFLQNKRNFFAIATHDSHLVQMAKDFSLEYKSNFEFEMLMGVRDKLKAELVSQKYKVREYIPYGPEWFAYSMRRLREKKSNIFLLFRSLFS